MIVVDTSVLVDFFRGKHTAATAELERLERNEVAFAIPTICCQELLQGARDDHEWDLLDTYLSTQLRVSPTDPWRCHRDAARLYFDCRRAGITVRSTVDCMVAQLTIEATATLLHSDADFDRIADVHPLAIHPV